MQLGTILDVLKHLFVYGLVWLLLKPNMPFG